MKDIVIKYFVDRKDWRKWLEANFETADAVWLQYPLKKTGKPRILYNDAVEEALCFGWIDSTVKSFNEESSIQKFCRRRKNSSFSQQNIERLKWLVENHLVHPSILDEAKKIIQQDFVFPGDILRRLQADKEIWAHYQAFSDSYKRIRIAYIDSARIKPEEFEKRLKNFIEKTRQNKLTKDFGGIEKYY